MSRGKVLAMAGAAAFIAAMLAGPGAAIFPSTLRWAGWIACPSGTTPTPRTFRSSYRAPGHTEESTNVVFYCVAPDGTEHDRTPAAMGGLFLMYFVGTFTLVALLNARSSSSSSTFSTSRRSAAAPTRPVAATVETQARELMAQDQKIHAIKIVRDSTGMGLKEAKDWVEALQHRAPSAASSASSPTAGRTGIGAVDRLAELKRMYDTGLITLDEFEAKKAQILAEL